MFTNIEYTIKDGIATIALNRPKAHNAIDPAIYNDLDRCLNEARYDTEVRVLIIRGNGPSFSSGFDLKQSAEQTELPMWEQFDWLHQQREILKSLWSFPKPTIAAVHGHCIGAGYHLMNHCDLVYAAEDAQFSEPEARYSLLPQPLTLWHARSARQVKEFLFMGDVLTPVEAVELGIVNRVFNNDDFESEVHSRASKLALMPEEIITATKRMLNNAADIQGFSTMHEWAWDQFLISKNATTKVKEDFGKIADEQGMREAYKWMRERYA